MSAFLIVHVTMKDPDKFQTYAEATAPTLAAVGAEVLIKGKMANMLIGKHNSDVGAVIKFPDQAAIDTWYNSDEYQALIPNRDAAADIVAIRFDAAPG